jgi:Flp pilus assembly protein TadG
MSLHDSGEIPVFGAVAARAAAYAHNQRGGVAIMFGLIFLPLLLLFGGSLDYSQSTMLRSRLVQLADSAALAAAKNAAVAYSTLQASCASNSAGNNTNNFLGSGCGNIQTSAQNVGIGAGEQIMASDSASGSKIAQHNISLSYDNKGTWNATVTYQATSITSFLKVIGIQNIPVSGSSTSSITNASDYYMNIYMALDTSMSMGIGSSATDIARMQTLTGCAFGCHTAGYSYQYYTVPKSQGIRFRIDDLRDATGSLVTAAQRVVSVNSHNHIQMGVFTFDNSITTIVNTTSNLSNVATAVQGIDLPTIDDGTQIDNALSWINSKKIVGNGDGSSSAKPAEIVFLVTDGVQDGIYTNSWSGITGTTGIGLSWWGSLAGQPAPTSALIASACDGLKNKGVTVAVVYTTYVPFTGTEQYDRLIGPFAAGIPAHLQSCATPEYFFTASTPADIASGMQQLFNKAVAAAPLRLKS